VCLEVDFPIAPINALSNLEGNAGKPIYQMSKWWARRRSSVFRSLLIAAATESPDDPTQAAKLVWDHYYCNHEKLREAFGAARYKKANGPWQERFMPPIVMSTGGHNVIMGQRKWKVQGGFPHVCHGGLTLLEVAVPWIEFEAI
ncbi:unnamed protein product, partial [marine sediment metagenome]